MAGIGIRFELFFTTFFLLRVVGCVLLLRSLFAQLLLSRTLACNCVRTGEERGKGETGYVRCRVWIIGWSSLIHSFEAYLFTLLSALMYYRFSVVAQVMLCYSGECTSLLFRTWSACGVRRRSCICPFRGFAMQATVLSYASIPIRRKRRVSPRFSMP